MSLVEEGWEEFVRQGSRSVILSIIELINGFHFKLSYKGRTAQMRKEVIALARKEKVIREAIGRLMLKPEILNQTVLDESDSDGETERGEENAEEERKLEKDHDAGECSGSGFSLKDVRRSEVLPEGTAAHCPSFSLSPTDLSNLIRETTIKAISASNFNNNSSKRPKLGDFYKYCQSCNIVYSGKPEERLNRFLNDINVAFTDFNFTDNERISAFRGVLRGQALDWYEGFCQEVRSSRDVERGLRDAFLPLDFDQDLKLRLLTEKMSLKITLSEYIRDFRSRNQELRVPLSERELLEAILRLMTPDYKKTLAVAVTNFESLRDLTLAARKADNIEASVKKLSQGMFNKSRVAELTEEVEAISHGQKGVCFNCGVSGHFIAQCPVPRKSVSQSSSLEPSAALIDKIVEAVLAKLNNKDQAGNEGGLRCPGNRQAAISNNLETNVVILKRDSGELSDAMEELSSVMRPRMGDERAYVSIVIGGDPICCLIDSGSTISCFAGYMFDFLHSKKLNVIDYRKSGIAANGTKLEMLGICPTIFSLGNKVFKANFKIVKGLTCQAIIGNDLLKSMNAIIRFSEGLMTISDPLGAEDVPLVKISEINQPDLINYIDDCFITNSIELPDGSIYGEEDYDGEENDFHWASQSWGYPEEKSNEWENIVFDDPRISEEEGVRMNNVLKKWSKQFESSPGLLKDFEAKIYVKEGTVPIRSKPKWMPAHEVKLLQAEIDALMKAGKITDGDGEYSSPVFTVKKPNSDKRRMVISYVKVNEICHSIAGGTPRSSDIIQMLRENCWRTRLDMENGYHQIKLSDSASKILQFVTPWNSVYKPLVLTQGHKCSMAIFVQAIRGVLAPFINQGQVILYVDDVFVVSSGSFDDHIEILEQVLSRIREYGLRLNFSKLLVCPKKLEILGHVVEGNNVKPSPNRLEAITNLLAPKTVRQVRRFLGMVNYFRRFIPNASTVLAPLSNLTKKGINFEWGETEQASFDLIKKSMTESAVLMLPAPEDHLRLEVDASGVGVGGVLYAVSESGEVKGVVEYYSAKFTDSQSKFDTSTRELLGILWACEKMSSLLHASIHPTTVISDHAALVWLFKNDHVHAKFYRYRARLAGFNLIVKYKRGSDNQVPDFLSREGVEAEIDLLEINSIDPDYAPDFKLSMDPWYRNLKESILLSPDKYPLFCVNNSLLYKFTKDKIDNVFNKVLVVPTDFRENIIQLYHDSVHGCHRGINKTLSRIKEGGYYWPKMDIDVKRYVRSCQICAKSKVPGVGKFGLMKVRPANLRVFSAVYIDLVGPLPRSKEGYTHLVTCLDEASRYLIAKPIRKATTESVIKILMSEVVLIHGAPELWISDRGSQFTSNVFKEWCVKNGAKHHLIPAYRPQNNAVERQHRTLKEAIVSLIKSHSDWSTVLPYCVQAINNSKSELLGVAPSLLAFGRIPRSPMDACSGVRCGECLPFDPESFVHNLNGYLKRVWSIVKLHVAQARNVQAARYNLRRHVQLYNVGDLVYRKNYAQSKAVDGFTKSLADKYIGPVKISKKVSDTQYELVTLDGRILGTFSVDHLKAFVPRVNPITNT